MVIKNKRGYIRIIEAFIAILLIAGTLLIVINQGYIGKTDISEQVYQIQLSILREIELNDTLRQVVLEADVSTEAPQIIINKVNERKPDYLTCKTRVCSLDLVCPFPGDPIEEDIFAQAVAITANLETFSPRQLKLFCWSNS